MYEKRWELVWVLELLAEWEVEDRSKYVRPQTATEKGVVVQSPVRVM